MSDSLNATLIVSVFVLTISAKPELEPPEPLEELELPPRLPAEMLPPLLLEEELDEDPVDDEEEPLDPPADTFWPGVRLDSETMVPLTGA